MWTFQRNLSDFSQGTREGKHSVRVQFFCSQHGCEGVKIRIYVGCDDLHEGMLTYTIRIDKGANISCNVKFYPLLLLKSMLNNWP